MLEADRIIDLGTGGGDEGGKLIYQGNLGGLLQNSESLTGCCIKRYITQNE